MNMLALLAIGMSFSSALASTTIEVEVEVNTVKCTFGIMKMIRMSECVIKIFVFPGQILGGPNL